MEFGDVQNGILGVTGLALNSEAAEELKVDITEGFYVSGIEEKSGADLAGISEGDIIRKLDNVEINKFSDLSGYLKTKSPNDVVNVEVLRGNNIKNISVTLTNKEDLYVEFMDMQLRDIPLKAKQKYPELEKGVMISQNRNPYFYNKVGLREGYVITAINGVKVESIEDINALKAKYNDEDFFKSLNKLEFLDGSLEKKEILFR
jgi:S1-C subfamily serine protease